MFKKNINFVLNLFAKDLSPDFLEGVKTSVSLQKLFHLLIQETAEDCYSISNGIIISLEEIEKNLFWDVSVDRYYDKHSGTKNKQETFRSENVPAETTLDPILKSIPPYIGLRHPLVLWNFVFMKLLDRAIYSSTHYEILRNQLISTKYSAIKLLIFFHQSLLWNLCLIRFTSQFVMMATMFGKKSILHYINPESCNNEIIRIPDHHPLSQLRFFTKDIVFLSQNPESQLGGGFLGVLCLGNSTVNVETATRVYAQERLAHEELLQYIVQLKINSARKYFEEQKKDESSYFSIQNLCQNSLSQLAPVLSTTVDFHGFRINVYPLPYRTPLELKADSLSPQVSEEIYYINKHNVSLHKLNQSTNITFLQIQDELFHCIHLHKVYRLLQPCHSFDTVEAQRSHYFRPLSVSMYLEKTTKNDLCTKESQIPYQKHFATLDEPYGLVAFIQKRLVCFNPFTLPQIPHNPSALLKKNVRPYPPPECLLRYITTHRIPRVIATLEKQPLYTPYDSLTLRSYLHSQGLNMRHLGLFISGTRPSWIHATILVEIVSRVSKRFITRLIQIVVLESKNTPTHNSICEPRFLINSRQRHVLELFLKENYMVSRDFIQSFLDILFFALPAPEKTHTLWETVSIHFLQLLLRSNFTSTTLWRFILAPSAADRFQCHESFIDLSQCPRIALVNAFLHHLGLHVNLEFQGESVFKRNEQGLRTPYAYIQKDKFVPTTHCTLKSITPKGCVALFHTSTSLYKFQHVLPLYNHLEHISVDVLLGEPENEVLSETKEENETNFEKSSPHNAKSVSWRYWTDKPEIIDFLLTSFFVICNAVDDVALLQQRHIALNFLLSLKTNTSHQHESTSRQCIKRLLFSLIPEFEMILSSVTKISIKNLPEAWSIQRKNLNHSFSDSLLTMTSWALRNHLWAIAQSTAIDSYRTFAKNCIASIHSRRVVGWTAFLSSMTSQNPMSSSCLETEKYYHDVFQQCLFMVQTYWDASHPINVDTLLSYAWIFYMKQDYKTCRQLIHQALSTILMVLKTNGMESFDDFFEKNYNNFASFVLNPNPTVCSETLPSQFPKERIGQLYRLLGALDVSEVDEILVDSNLTDSSLKTQSLIDSALLNFQNAIKVLKEAYKDKTTKIILALPLFEMGATLFLKHQSTTQSTPNQGNLRQALVYFLSALKLYSVYFKSHHWNVVQTALCVAKLFVLTNNHLQAMHVFEQILKDILPYAVKFKRLQNAKNESYYDCLFHDGYRPSNMFSLIVWCVPNYYFTKATATQPSSSSNETLEKRLKHYKSTLNQSFQTQFFLVLSEAKKSIFSLYINKTIPQPFLSKTFHLFKRFYSIKNTIDRLYDELAQYILSSYKGTDSKCHENISLGDELENFSSLPSVRNDNESNILQLIRNYPRLLGEKQVLALLDRNYAKNDSSSSPIMNKLFSTLLTKSQHDLEHLEENIKKKRLKHMNLFKTFSPSSFQIGGELKDTQDYDSTFSDCSTNRNYFEYKQLYESQFTKTHGNTQENVLGFMRNSNPGMTPEFPMHTNKNVVYDDTKPFLFSESANNRFTADAAEASPEFTTQCLMHYDQEAQNDLPTESDLEEMAPIKLFSMKRFLGINDPLEWYPLQTLSLDYIFTLFYHYFDISQIENRMLADAPEMSDSTLLGSHLMQEPFFTDTGLSGKQHAYCFLFSEAPSCAAI